MSTLTPETFEKLLGETCRQLTNECQTRGPFQSSDAFAKRVREIVQQLLASSAVDVNFHPHPHVFPDIELGEFGIEVKFTAKDNWRIVGNSVFESTRSEDVSRIYVIFGKMGGEPLVDWDKYDNCVIHVRTSHVPRFELEIHAKESLFTKINVSYADFCRLPISERMNHIRAYARSRLKTGDRLWWLEDRPDEGHTLPIQARLYMNLEQSEKRRLRAEAALLCPQIVKPARAKHKYDDAAMFLLTYHGVLCPQSRDLFSAGSVAMRGSLARGGNYVMRALQDIESEMREAAKSMNDELFVEYWGNSVSPQDRIPEWLKRADQLAKNWVPSNSLFVTPIRTKARPSRQTGKNRTSDMPS